MRNALAEDIELYELAPGSYFGESALIKDSRRNFTMIAATRYAWFQFGFRIGFVLMMEMLNPCLWWNLNDRCVLVSIDNESLQLFFKEVPEAYSDFEVRLQKYEVTLTALLHHTLGVKYFRQHLTREFAAENIDVSACRIGHDWGIGLSIAITGIGIHDYSSLSLSLSSIPALRLIFNASEIRGAKKLIR